MFETVSASATVLHGLRNSAKRVSGKNEWATQATLKTTGGGGGGLKGDLGERVMRNRGQCPRPFSPNCAVVEITNLSVVEWTLFIL